MKAVNINGNQNLLDFKNGSIIIKNYLAKMFKRIFEKLDLNVKTS